MLHVLQIYKVGDSMSSVNVTNIANNEFNCVMARFKVAANVKKDPEVAEKLGMKIETYRARKSRGSIPKEEMRTYCIANSIDFEWVETGKGVTPQNQNNGQQFLEVRKTELAMRTKEPITLYDGSDLQLSSVEGISALYIKKISDELKHVFDPYDKDIIMAKTVKQLHELVNEYKKQKEGK